MFRPNDSKWTYGWKSDGQKKSSQNLLRKKGWDEGDILPARNVEPELRQRKTGMRLKGREERRMRGGDLEPFKEKGLGRLGSREPPQSGEGNSNAGKGGRVG